MMHFVAAMRRQPKSGERVLQPILAITKSVILISFLLVVFFCLCLANQPVPNGM